MKILFNKKSIVQRIVALLFLIMLLVACQNDDAQATETSQPATSATAPADVLTVANPADTPVVDRISYGQTSTPRPSLTPTPTTSPVSPAPLPTRKAAPPTPIATTVISASPTQSPTSTPVQDSPTANPLPPSPSPVVIPTELPTLTVTATPTVTPTPTIPPTPTIVPTPVNTPFPTATITPLTPLPTADPFASSKKAGAHSGKYGVIVDEGNLALVSAQLQTTQSDWYLRFDSDLSQHPAGKSRPIYIEVSPSRAKKTHDQLQTLANQMPGAVWYVSGEPNRQFSVDTIIEDLRYYYTEIKSVDSTARITSPSVLNWDFTCIGCGGYTSGHVWMAELVTRYQDLYGTSPPWDVWAIDLYPLDWQNFPNTGFLPETIAQYAPNLPPNSESIPAKQLDAYRNYIDSLPGRAGDPILVTEIGVHWGWSDIKFGTPGCGSGEPAGEYKPLVLRDYFDSIFTWLEDHATSHNIERWFTYTTYSDVANCRYDGYSGMSLLDSLSLNAGLTDLGRWYVARSAP